MATDDPDRTPTRQTAFEELAGRLRELHDGTHARTVAQELLRHATGGVELVALVDDGARAVFFDRDGRGMTTVPLSRHGLAASDAEPLWTRVGDPSTWVDATDDGELAWIHPRYRWANDEDRSSWWYRTPRR